MDHRSCFDRDGGSRATCGACSEYYKECIQYEPGYRPEIAHILKARALVRFITEAM